MSPDNGPVSCNNDTTMLSQGEQDQSQAIRLKLSFLEQTLVLIHLALHLVDLGTNHCSSILWFVIAENDRN